jgi:hypothetical protein
MEKKAKNQKKGKPGSKDALLKASPKGAVRLSDKNLDNVAGGAISNKLKLK